MVLHLPAGPHKKPDSQTKKIKVRHLVEPVTHNNMEIRIQTSRAYLQACADASVRAADLAYQRSQAALGDLLAFNLKEDMETAEADLVEAFALLNARKNKLEEARSLSEKADEEG